MAEAVHKVYQMSEGNDGGMDNGAAKYFSQAILLYPLVGWFTDRFGRRLSVRNF